MAPFIFAIGFLGNLPGMYIPAAVISAPCTPYALHHCTGCVIRECAQKLDKKEFVKEYDLGFNTGYSGTNFRKNIDEMYANGNACLQRVTNPCCGPSEG